MVKLFCDRCGKELDNENMKYVGVIFNVHDDDNGYETWEFCKECASNLKRGMIRNIVEYDNGRNKE